MSTPLSFCDISARYGQAPAPQKTLEEQTGWNSKELFLSYLSKVREQRRQDAKEDKEDALMAMIDAMNAPEEDREAGRTDMAGAESLRKAGQAIIKQYDGKVAPSETLAVQALLACLGDRFTFEEADEVQDNREKAQKLEEEKSLEVTEARDPGNPSAPDEI